MPGKLSVAQNLKPALRTTLYQNISLIIVYFFFYQTNLVFLPFDILCISKFIQCLWHFFIRASKILMRLNIVLFECLQPQKVLIMFLFSTRHLYQLMTKFTPIITFSVTTIIRQYTNFPKILWQSFSEWKFRLEKKLYITKSSHYK